MGDSFVVAKAIVCADDAAARTPYTGNWSQDHIPGREAALRVLLLYPDCPDTFWSLKHALKFIRKKAGAPPLGLLTVAAMLPPEWESG